MEKRTQLLDQLNRYKCQKPDQLKILTLATNVSELEQEFHAWYNTQFSRFEIECSIPKFLLLFLNNPRFVAQKIHTNKFGKLQIVEGYFDPVIQNCSFF